MTMWVFGYGSLIWKASFPYDHRLLGFIKDYRRVFFQGSTDHRGTEEFPGRTVTLESFPGGSLCRAICLLSGTIWFYSISAEEDRQIATEHLEVREKQYDKKEYLNFFIDRTATEPALTGVMVYIASPDKKLNRNYLGPASLEDIARQIILARGPSGPNRDYLFELEKDLIQIGHHDEHVMHLAEEVRRLLSEEELANGEA